MKWNWFKDDERGKLLNHDQKAVNNWPLNCQLFNFQFTEEKVSTLNLHQFHFSSFHWPNVNRRVNTCDQMVKLLKNKCKSNSLLILKSLVFSRHFHHSSTKLMMNLKQGKNVQQVKNRNLFFNIFSSFQLYFQTLSILQQFVHISIHHSWYLSFEFTCEFWE